jgi:hypothetical protein
MKEGKKPYIDEEYCGFFLRTFPDTVSIEELIWHRDKKNRKITVILGKGWKLQMDNEMPIDLIPKRNYTIPRETFHRLLKGTGMLLLKIIEENE